MRVIGFSALALLLTLVAPGLQADQHKERKRPVTIPFADLGGIENWRPVGDEAILIETRRDKWYRATFFGPCIGLNYSTAVGFVTHPSGSVDKFSSILVDGQRCWFKSLEEVPKSELEEYHD